MRPRPLAPVIAAVSVVGLAGCSPGKTLMAAGSAVSSGVGAAAGAVGSVASGTVSALGSAVGGGGETAVAEATGAATPATVPVGDAAAASATGQPAAAAAAAVGATGAAVSPAATAAAGGAPAALSDGIAACIRSFDPSVAAGALFGGSWTYAREGMVPAGEDVGDANRLRAMRNAGVAASVVAGQRCTFRSDAIAGAAARAMAREVLDDVLAGDYTAGSPFGRTGDCEGYTFRSGGQLLWMYFTDALGGTCDGAGAGVTIRPVT